MTDYIEILDTQIDPDAPITSSLGYQFRDNPIAIAEGSPGAPKIAIAARPRSANGGNANFTGLGVFSGFEAHGMFAVTAGSPAITVAASDDGSSYGSASTMYTALSGATSGGFHFAVNFADGAFAYTTSDTTSTGTTHGTGTLAGVSLDTTAIRFTIGAGGAVSVMGRPNGGVAIA